MTTAPSSALLEIQLYLCDGSTAKFTQSDPEIVGEILDNLRPEKLFAGPNLLLVGDHSTAAFAPTMIARVDFSRPDQPDWFPTSETVGTDIRELTSTQVAARHASGAFSRTRQPSAPGEPVTELVELTMCGGHRCFLEVHSVALPIAAQRRVLHELFNKASVSCRRYGGGIAVFNKAQVVSETFYPGLLEPPVGTWRAERVLSEVAS